MMAKRRVVIVKDFLKLQSASASGLTPFQSYIENPNPYTILCLIDTKLPDGRSEPGKTLRKKSKSPGGAIGVYEFQKIPDPLLPEWVIDWTRDRKSTRLNSSHVAISYAVFCLKKK